MGRKPVKYYKYDYINNVDEALTVLSPFFREIQMFPYRAAGKNLYGGDELTIAIRNGEPSIVYTNENGLMIDLLNEFYIFTDGFIGVGFDFSHKVSLDFYDKKSFDDVTYKINLSSSINQWFTLDVHQNLFGSNPKNPYYFKPLNPAYIETSNENNDVNSEDWVWIKSILDKIHKNLISHMRYSNYTYNGSVDSLDTISAWTSKDKVFHVVSDNIVYRPTFPFKLGGLFISMNSIKNTFEEIPWPLEQKIIDE